MTVLPCFCCSASSSVFDMQTMQLLSTSNGTAFLQLQIQQRQPRYPRRCVCARVTLSLCVQYITKYRVTSVFAGTINKFTVTFFKSEGGKQSHAMYGWKNGQSYEWSLDTYAVTRVAFSDIDAKLDPPSVAASSPVSGTPMYPKAQKQPTFGIYTYQTWQAAQKQQS